MFNCGAPVWSCEVLQIRLFKRCLCDDISNNLTDVDFQESPEYLTCVRCNNLEKRCMFIFSFALIPACYMHAFAIISKQEATNMHTMQLRHMENFELQGFRCGWAQFKRLNPWEEQAILMLLPGTWKSFDPLFSKPGSHVLSSTSWRRPEEHCQTQKPLTCRGIWINVSEITASVCACSMN